MFDLNTEKGCIDAILSTGKYDLYLRTPVRVNESNPRRPVMLVKLFDGGKVGIRDVRIFGYYGHSYTLIDLQSAAIAAGFTI